MNNTLPLLIQALKTCFRAQENHSKTQSFTLLFGKQKQGLGRLIAQSNLTQYPVEGLSHAAIYYKQTGIVLQLSEEWLMQNNDLLANSLAKIDEAYPPLGISATAMAINIQDLMIEDPREFEARVQTQLQLWQWVQGSLPRAVPSHIIITQADTLAGFCEFFHQDFRPESRGTLGFYCPNAVQAQNAMGHIAHRFQQLLQQLDQQVLEKLHPVRSTLKRTLIREFPLQLQTLGKPLLRLIQVIEPSRSRLRAVYFTSAMQGAGAVDPINQKIQHEYALSLPSQHLQSPNKQSYFVDACLEDILECSQVPLPANRKQLRNLSFSVLAIAFLALGISSTQYWRNARTLDAVSKEMLQYEHISASDKHSLSGLFHLGEADSKIQQIRNGLFTPAAVIQFKQDLHQHTQKRLRQVFLPELLQEAEQAMLHANTPETRFAALKTYIMLGDPIRYDDKAIRKWYQHHWAAHKTGDARLQVLDQSLRQPLQPARLNDRLIQDTQNALNALPDAYFYYSLARAYFPTESTKLSLPGFHLSSQDLPSIYTKAGFEALVQQLDSIAAKIQKDSWVTDRHPPANMRQLLLETYAYEYRQWWNTLLNRSRIQSAESYQQAQNLLRTLRENNSFTQLIQLAQQHTSPVGTDPSGLFNRDIARAFAQLNWLGTTTLQSLEQEQADLENFSRQLDLLQNQPENLLELTQQRFNNPHATDPLSVMYHSSEKYPSPIKEWNKQLADNLWFHLIQDSKTYIENQWRAQIIPFYQQKIGQKYPFNSNASAEVDLGDFYRFFKPNGTLQQFNTRYLQAFLDTRNAQWTVKEKNGFRLPVNPDAIRQLILANVLQTMFFNPSSPNGKLHFSVDKIALDPMVKTCTLSLGTQTIRDRQGQESPDVDFIWPSEGASLELESLDGKKWRLRERGPWALFHLLDKVNVMVDPKNPAALQILFEINGNSGRYTLETTNPINPFTPGILGQFRLPEDLV